jgi:deoxyribonucleoside regulator
MAAVARSLPANWNEGVHVVQINGAVALRSGAPRTNAVAEDFAAAGPGEATLLPVPAIVGNPATREVLEKDRVVADVIALARSAPVLCFSFGGLGRGSVLVTSGYLTPQEIDGLRRRDAVGDVLGRFVDGAGRIADPGLDSRTIGLHLEERLPREWIIGVSFGASKHPVVVASLRQGYINVLVTDEATAEYALAAKPAGDD